MAAAGLKQNVMTVRWKPSDPLNIPDRAALDVAVPNAIAAGIEVVFAVYPYPPSELEVGGVSHLAFAAWLDQLARAYPQVTTYIVGNEPNLNTFWRPQGSWQRPDPLCRPVRAFSRGRLRRPEDGLARDHGARSRQLSPR